MRGWVAEGNVWRESSRSEVPPHIQPPIAHVPKAIREAIRPDVPIPILSIAVTARRPTLVSESCAAALFEEISNAIRELLEVRGTGRSRSFPRLLPHFGGYRARR